MRSKTLKQKLTTVQDLVGQQYSWTSSIFYFGYLFASIPGSYGFVKLPLGKFLAASMILWAVILACHGAASSFATLMVLRFLLGALESVISPGFSLITSLWYKPSEHAWRHGLWFAGNGTASIFGGLLGYAIGKIDHGLAPWRWLFIIFGLFTLVWSIFLAFFLPDSALKAKWLAPHERQVAHSRPQKRNHSFKTNDWKLHQALEAVKDPKTWLLFWYTILTSFPNGGYTNVSSSLCSGAVLRLTLHSSLRSSLRASNMALCKLFYSECRKEHVKSSWFSGPRT